MLHAHDLKISHYTLARGTTTIPGGDNYNENQYDPITDKWTITVPQALQANVEHTIKVFYLGYMRDDMEGFYKSYYIENGKKVWMGSTQFQQTEARRAFPCFDVRKKKF